MLIHLVELQTGGLFFLELWEVQRLQSRLCPAGKTRHRVARNHAPAAGVSG